MARIFAPGVAQGVVQSMDAAREDEVRRQNLAVQKQAMDFQKFQMEQARQAEARRLAGVQGAGWALEAPPPVGQTPSPGQPSVPMTPPGGGMQGGGMTPPPQMSQVPQAPGMLTPPQMSPTPQPQAIPPYQTARPPMQPTGQFQGDPQAIMQEIARIKSPQDRQAAMAQFGQQTPSMRPPPVAPKPEATQSTELTLPVVLQRLQAHNASPDQIMATLEQLTPVFNMQGAETKQQLALVKEQLSAERAATAAQQGWARIGQGQARVEQGQERIEQSKLRDNVAAQGINPSVVDYYAERAINGDYSWRVGLSRSKGGSAIIAAVENAVPAMAKAKDVSPMETVGRAADIKANTTAYTNVTKDLAAIRPYKVMLDTNIGIAKKLAGNVLQSDSKLANKTLNWIKTNMGDNPDTAEFLAQIHFVETEAARVLANPRLVGQLTDSARADMEAVINGNMPLNSLNRVLDRIKADGLNRVKAMEAESANLRKAVTGAASTPPSGPKPGTVEDGYRFKGGNPADQSSWEKV